MNKEEIKDYLKRVDELELKLTGEDRETYQWVLFGYNECARLLEEKEQENKELLNKIDKAIKYLVNPVEKIWEGHSIDEVVRILKDSDVDD